MTRFAQAMGALAIACTFGAWAGCEGAEDGGSHAVALVDLVPDLAAPAEEVAPPLEARPTSPPREIAEDPVETPSADPIDVPPADSVEEVREAPRVVEARREARRRRRRSSDSGRCPECTEPRVTGPRVTLRTHVTATRGPIDQAAVQERLRRGDRSLAECFTDPNSPRTRGRLEIDVASVIRPDGQMSFVPDSGGPLTTDEQTCLENSARSSWRLPSREDPAIAMLRARISVRIRPR